MPQTNHSRFNIENSVLSSLLARGFSARQISDFQIKVGLYIFYETTGTIMVDGGRPIEAKGLAAFIELLTRIHTRNSQAHPPTSQSKIQMYEARLRKGSNNRNKKT